MALSLPILMLLGWSQLQAQKSRVNLERFEEWSAGGSGVLIRPLLQYFLETRRPAGPGDTALPPVPTGIGVKAWSIDKDSILRVALDARVDGDWVVLNYVPVVRTADAAFYDCASTTSTAHIGRFCHADVLRSVADIPAQLQANARTLSAMPAIVSASGVELPSGVAAGSVVVAPPNAADLNHCGFQCVKPQSCVTPRPVACGRDVEEGNSRWLDIAATGSDFRGSEFATRTQADQACAQSLGAGFRVLESSSLGGVFRLAGGREYWVHNAAYPQRNCWQTDYR